jgi:fibronectin-binding autotransporter adhesin
VTSAANQTLTITDPAAANNLTFGGAVGMGAGTLNATAGAIAVNATLTTSSTVTLSATTGGISDGNGSAVNVAAASLIASAATGIDLDTTLTNITATTTTGNIQIDETDGANVLTVSAPAGSATVTSATGNLSVTTVSVSGTATLTATAGAITDANGSGSNNVTANTLLASAATGINLDTTVADITATTSGAGAIALRELDGVTLTNVTAANGAITVTTGGNTTVTSVVSGTDNNANDISITASSGNITVATVNAGTSAGDATIIATAGSILDDNNDATVISGDVVTLTAAVDIGLPLTAPATEDIDTAANSLVLSTTGSTAGTHGMWVTDSDAVTVTNATTADGVIVLEAGGTLTAVSVVAGGTGRNVRLTTSAGDIQVVSVSAVGDIVKLNAAGAILDGDSTPDNNDVTAASLQMMAGSGIGTGVNPLETTVGNLAANAISGGIWLTNTGTLDITTVTVFSMTIMGVTAAGNIDISTTTDLTVSQPVASSGGTTHLTGGAAGAGNNITLNAAVTGSSVLVNGGAGNDTITVNASGSSAVTVDGIGGDDTYVVNLGALNGAVNVADSGATSGDELTVNGTSSADDLTVSNNAANTQPQTGGSIVSGAGETVQYTTTLETLTVTGNSGNDTFHVQPSQTATITVNGNAPVFSQTGVPPGDTLDFDSLGNTFSLDGKTILTDGGDPSAFQGVTFLSIETFNLTPAVPLANVNDPGNNRRFDFNNSAAGNDPAYTSVLPGVLYNATAGTADFGWTTPTSGFDRGAPNALLRDGHWAGAAYTARTFKAEVLDNGWYLVEVTMGDNSYGRDQMRVTNADTGQILMDGIATAAGQFVSRTVPVLVTDNTLDLTFSTTGGDPYWLVNSLELRPVQGRFLAMGVGPTGMFDPSISHQADGTTVDTLTVFGTVAGQTYTVATTLGTILTADANSNYAGIQVTRHLRTRRDSTLTLQKQM